ncbi:MAG TPA: EamA family transporter [Elusimicrobia bacterium]|nr:EamA family transporter [Elusimicrobiota bacterium]
MNYLFALGAAALFAFSVPAGKILLEHLKPLELSALCYMGSGFGLAVWRAVARRPGTEAPLERRDLPYAAGFIAAGGVLAPLLLFTGLNHTASSSASMLLNFELVFTSLIAVTVFKEHGGGRFWLAAALITAGALALSWEGGAFSFGWGAALVLASGLMWGIDNNLTARVSIKDPVTLACLKGLAGGFINGALALYAYGSLPSLKWAAAAMALGLFCYGISLVLFILAMRGLGASRAGAFFGSYPFIGAALSVAMLAEPVTGRLLFAGALMLGAFMLLSMESHGHRHRHEPLAHDHGHGHDDGHHTHPHGGAPAARHSHPHSHDTVEHEHPHLPDVHHRHGHG